jgi:hypothetical protein
MNEVEIPLKITGIGAMKAELRELKGAIADATDPAQMAELSARAGELKDKIGDANAAVNVFASGSKFEQVSNSIGGIKDSLMSLDFEEAQQKAQVFSQVMGKLNPADLAKGFSGLMGTMKTVGGAFVKLGMQILANPIFLLVAAIVAIVVAIGFLLKKMGVLDAIMKVMMIPIQAIIDAFYALTDALGLTSHAEEEAAEVTKKAEEDKRAAVEESYGNRQKLFNLTKDMSAEEIKMMEDQLGVRINTAESEFDIEREKQEELKASYERQIATLDAITEAGGELTEEQIKDREKLVTGWKDSNKAIENNEANRAKAIVDINRKQNDQLTAWKLKNIKDDNVRAKEQFKLDEQQAIAELEKNITRAKQLGQDTSKFEQIRAEIKTFYAGEAKKVDDRVAKQQSDAAAAISKENASRAKEQQAEYEKRVEEKLKTIKKEQQLIINATKEGTQERVTAEKNALDKELEYITKNAKTLKLTKLDLQLAENDYIKKKTKLQEDFDAKQKNLNNEQAKAEAESLMLNAKTEEEKLAAKEAVLKAEAKIELDNKELTAIQIKNIEDKLTNELEEIETQKTNLKIAAAKKILDAEQLAAETKQSAEAFALERFKGTKEEEIAANEAFLETQLSTLEKQRLTELANKQLSVDEIAAIEEKYRQAKITAEEATATKIVEIDDKAREKLNANINAGFQLATQAMTSLTSLQDISTKKKLKGVEKGSKEEEVILKRQFEQQKKMQLAMAVINGAQAIVSILAQYPKFDGGFSMAAALAGSVIATATSLATIASSSFEGGGTAPDAPDTNSLTGGGTGGMATPNASLFGSNNNLNNVGAPQEGQQGQNITVTAIVSETEMTSTQDRVNRIKRNAEL